MRHGIANLYRPGAHAQSVLVALGVGVMFTLTVYLVQHGMIAEMNRTSPPGMPNVFLIDIAPKDRDAVLDLIKQQRGVEGTPELIGTVAAKLLNVDGQDVASMDLKGFGRRYRSPRSVTSAGEMPDYVNLERGQWWTSPTAARKSAWMKTPREFSASSRDPQLRWSISGKELQTRVACIQTIDSVHLSSRVEFIFNTSALAGFPIIYYSSLRAQPSAVPALQEALYKRFPTVTVVNVADVLQIVQGVVDRISQVVRFISMFAILAGAVILSSSRGGHALPPHARSGDSQNARRHALARQPHLFRRVSGAGRRRRADGQLARRRVRQSPVEAHAGREDLDSRGPDPAFGASPPLSSPTPPAGWPASPSWVRSRSRSCAKNSLLYSAR